MSTPHCRKRHRHKPKVSTIMRSVREIMKVLDKFNNQDEIMNFVDFVENLDIGWKVHHHERPKC